ncbi:MAG TPA: sulfatase-like hydrolase/transferase [Gammaproteobacteria bacterium]
MRQEKLLRRIEVAAWIFVSACLMSQAGLAAEEANRPGDRPNILLIIGDDIGSDVMSSLQPELIDDLVEQYGPSGRDHPEYRSIRGRPASTPTLDQLAREGILFTSVWAHPFCSPTRASILTGLFAAKTHVATYADPLAQGHTSFVQLLRDEAGYRTAVFGKWHMAGLPGRPVSYPGMKPKEAGFDVFKGNLHAAIRTYWEYDYHVQDADTPADTWRTEAPPVRSLPGIEPTTYAPVVKAADAIEWIEAQEATEPDRPWFVWLAFNLSHATAQRTPSSMAVPNADTLDRETYAEMRECGGKFGSAEVGACTGEQLMRAMTNSMDTVIGKVLAAVAALDPNTYVIYIGDNGTPMYGRPNLDFIDNMYITRRGRGKGTAYESGARVPLVVHGPGIAPNTQSHAFAHAADLFPTILELAGLEVPSNVSDASGTGEVPLDGVSLMPVVMGNAESVRDPNYGYVLTETENLLRNGLRQVGARNATYKVICTRRADGKDCELYDLRADPLEEFPLEVPASCDGYETLGVADPHWHYCRLVGIVETRSIL